MSTIAVNIGIMRTESRTRSVLMNLRSTHKDVVSCDSLTRELAVGQFVTYTATRFFYGFLRDSVELVTVVGGTPAVTMNLTNVVGLIAFPYPCTVTFSVPTTSAIVLARRLEAIVA
jgi:hypothetical protein